MRLGEELLGLLVGDELFVCVEEELPVELLSAALLLAERGAILQFS